MRVLLTGSTGFLGSNIKLLLENFGHEVICPRSPTFLPKWDMLEPSGVQEIFTDEAPDVIVHSAWGVNETNYRESNTNLQWQTATTHLYKLASAAGVRQFIALGSFSETEQDIFSGENRDESIYAEAKRQTRSEIFALESKLRLPASWLRIQYPYGCWDKPNRLISLIIQKAILGEEFELKSPNLELDFIHSLDIANAVRTVIEQRITGIVEVKTYEKYSLRDVQDKIMNLLLQDLTQVHNKINLVEYIRAHSDKNIWRALIPLDLGLLDMIADSNFLTEYS